MDFRGGKTTDIAEQGGDCRGLESQWTGYEAPCPQFGDLIPSLAGICITNHLRRKNNAIYIFTFQFDYQCSETVGWATGRASGL